MCPIMRIMSLVMLCEFHGVEGIASGFRKQITLRVQSVFNFVQGDNASPHCLGGLRVQPLHLHLYHSTWPRGVAVVDVLFPFRTQWLVGDEFRLGVVQLSQERKSQKMGGADSLAGVQLQCRAQGGACAGVEVCTIALCHFNVIFPVDFGGGGVLVVCSLQKSSSSVGHLNRFQEICRNTRDVSDRADLRTRAVSFEQRLALDELRHDASERPQIHTLVVLGAQDDLGSAIPPGDNVLRQGLGLFWLLVDDPAHAKVANLQVAVA
mmetsp:Transcript_6558/g.16096  ORF Transcript_6558/g.16096 Transcript_6558/m.16096 type:complete len:265 (-) Transcript_6558:70-864(-)